MPLPGPSPADGRQARLFLRALYDDLKRAPDPHLLSQRLHPVRAMLEGNIDAPLLVEVTAFLGKLAEQCADALKPHFVDIVDLLVGWFLGRAIVGASGVRWHDFIPIILGGKCLTPKRGTIWFKLSFR